MGSIFVVKERGIDDVHWGLITLLKFYYRFETCLTII